MLPLALYRVHLATCFSELVLSIISCYTIPISRRTSPNDKWFEVFSKTWDYSTEKMDGLTLYNTREGPNFAGNQSFGTLAGNVTFLHLAENTT